MMKHTIAEARQRFLRRRPDLGQIVRGSLLKRVQVRAWLANYRKSKAILDKVCEVNQRLLRSARDGRSAGRD